MRANAASAKGAAVRGTLAFVEQTFGEATRQKVLAGLPSAHASALSNVAATDDVPYDRIIALWRAIDAEVAESTPMWAEQAGSFSIESMGVQLYSGILRKPTPSEFLTQSVSLFRLFYAPGDMRVVQEEPSGAVLRLVGFDPGTALFCRRQVGGLSRAIELAGGVAPRVRHVRCTLRGDAFCEWKMRWG